MATIDYKEKYEKAVQAAMLAKQDTESAVTVQTLEAIFPELAESEDEKIKKELIGFLKEEEAKANITSKRSETLCKYIAWLEKQGKKDEEILILKDQIESLHAAIKAIKETYKIELEKQGEQKSVEWSDKDEGELREIIEILTQRPFIGTYFLNKHIAWLNSLKDRVQPQQQEWGEEDELQMQGIIDLLPGLTIRHNWLKSLKDRVGCEVNCTTTKEWSEEDKSHIDSLLKRLEGMCKPGATFTSTGFAISEDEDWLKSLKDRVQQPKQVERKDEEMLNLIIARLHSHPNVDSEEYSKEYHWLNKEYNSLFPQNTWKPTKEQMEALMKARNDTQGKGYHNVLAKLHSDLTFLCLTQSDKEN